MKAVQFAQYGGPEVLQVYDVPDPIPGDEDVLIQVKATTVNHLDLFQRVGITIYSRVRSRRRCT